MGVKTRQKSTIEFLFPSSDIVRVGKGCPTRPDYPPTGQLGNVTVFYIDYQGGLVIRN